ncbi:MAG TPA: response regulator transcription factor [Anaerolineales bacterium]|jgi:two-component system KDP operon response regulator KdpE|nr:response regulator transcription factor [Anaerolineales bacterium]
MRAVFYSYHLDEAAVLQVVLQRAGFAPRQVQELAKFIDIWAERPSDLVLVAFGGAQMLDARIVETLRSQTMVPMVVIDDAFSEDQQVTLLEAGADLLVVRPYSPRVLIAQIRAMMRRSAGMPFFSLPILSQSGVMIDPSTRTIQVEDREIERLTQLEFRLLFTLMTHAGRVIPTETLVEYVWGFSGEGNRGLVRGLIQRLRSKVEPDPSSPRYIVTEPGLGYRFNPSQEFE